jgi:hypothetical protein
VMLPEFSKREYVLACCSLSPEAVNLSISI